MNSMAKVKRDDDVISTKTPDGNEQFIFNPYNPLNKEITQKEIEAVLQKHNVPMKINNFTLYKRAFIHKSYTKRPKALNEMNNITIVDKPDDCLPLYTKSNERLEFLGDGVLECIAKFYLYKRFPKSDEGFMTDTKIELVKNETIGRIVSEMGLHEWFMVSKHTEQKNIRTNHKRLGCLFEAFVGALFLDFNRINIHDEEKWFESMFHCGTGFQVAQLFVESVFNNYIDWTRITKQTENYKRPLQELLQSEFKTTPHIMEIRPFSNDYGYTMGVYLVLGQTPHGVKHNQTTHYSKFKTFESIHIHMAQYNCIYLFLGEGVHRIKQTAEQTACKNAIELFKQFQDFELVIQKVQQKHIAFS